MCFILLQCFTDVAQCIVGPDDASWCVGLLPPLQWMLVLTMVSSVSVPHSEAPWS